MMEQEAYRIERDSLGEVRVPAQALYGAQTQRAVENFPISGLRPWRAFIWSMAAIKRAAAEVHLDLGLLDEQRARAVIQAAEEVMAGATTGRMICARTRKRWAPVISAASTNSLLMDAREAPISEKPRE